MYNKLILFRNEFKNNNIYSYKFLGIVTELIYSKKIFKKNSDISEFLSKHFELEYKDYTMKSRSLIVAKLTKYLLDKDDKYYKKIADSLYIFLQEKIKLSNNKNKKDELSGWLK